MTVAGETRRGPAEAGPTRKPGLDAVRGVAVLLVVAGHAELAGFAWAAPVGLTLFFVLSGYLITGVLKDDPRLRRFYWRRAVRLLPALIIFVAAYGAVAIVAGRTHDAASAVLGLTYVTNWIRIGGWAFGGVGHLWSLAVEEQFYLVWPVLLLAFGLRRWFRAALVIAIVGVIALRLLPLSDEHLQYGTDTRLDALLLGALAFLVGWVPGRRAALGATAGLVLAVSAAAIGYVPVITLAALTGAVVVARMAHVSRAPQALRWFGTISYGLYLWHLPLILAYGLLGIPLAIAAAVASFYLVEQPLRRRWADRLPRRQVRSRVVDVGPVARVVAAVDDARST